MSAVLWVEQAVGHAVGDVLTRQEAEAVTAKIKGFAGVAWLLLLEAQQRQAHKAMGYATWAEYVETEFDMSRSRSYQLIGQAEAVLALNAAVSTSVDISEAMARDIKPLLPQAIEAVIEAEATAPAEATPDEVEERVRAALDGVRTAAVAARQPAASKPSDEAGVSIGTPHPASSVPSKNAPTADERFRDSLRGVLNGALRLTTEFADTDHNLDVQGRDQDIYLSDLRSLAKWVQDSLRAADRPTLKVAK